MGAAQSSPATEHVVHAPSEGTSVEFSPSLLQRLAHPSSSGSGNSTDDLVRQKLANESAALRQKEAEILGSITAALEKENLDREKPGMSSDALGRDIDEVREKVQRMVEDKKNKESPAIASAREGVIKCYLDNAARPLDCWRQVEAFKAEVNKLESAFVKSLQ